MKSILIKDTTRQEREQIVREALSACGGASVEEIYQPYIDGKKEIAEINAEARSGIVH